MEFLKIYDEVIKEFGFGIRCGIYSKVLEFHMNGETCYMSKQNLAAFMRCGKSTICEALAYLCEDKEHTVEVIGGKKKRIECADMNGKPVPKEPYIKRTERRKDDGSSDTSVYVINENHELFKRIMSSSKIGSPESGQGSPESGQGVVQNPDRRLSENRTDCSPESGHKKRIVTENNNRECEERSARELSTNAAAPSQDPKLGNSRSDIPGYPEISITESEREAFESMDFSKTKKTPQAYYAIMCSQIKEGRRYNDHYTQMRKWAMQDGAAVPAQKPSSIDMSVVDRIMDPYAWNCEEPF